MIRKTIAAALLVAVAATFPAPAHAQFGDALKRAAKKKAEQKAAEKVVEKAAGDGAAVDTASVPEAATGGARRGGGGRVTSAGSAPTFDGRTLELNPDVVGRFLKALAAEVPARAALAKDKQNEGRYRATTDKYERCTQKVQEKQAAAMQERQSDPRMMELQLKYWRAVMSGDTATVRTLTDTLVLGGFKPDSTCGRRPADAYEGINRLENAEREVEGTAADAGDFSIEQYAVIKERVIPWAAAKKQGKALQGGFTKAELEALDAKSAELIAGLKPHMEGNQ